MKNLENRQDIEVLVNTFYEKVEKSEIGFFFNDIMKVDWSKHLPKMYNFWATLLFGEVAYKGNPMSAHFPINEQQAMQKHHFETWIALWKETVDELFTGEMAESAKKKAGNVANLMAYKMDVDTKLRANSAD